MTWRAYFPRPCPRVLSRYNIVHEEFTKFKAVEGIEGHWFSKGMARHILPATSSTRILNPRFFS